MKFFLIYLSFLIICYAQLESIEGSGFLNQSEEYQMSSKRYHTDKDGNILMFVNVWGHVNSPGNHLVYEGVDMATLLSMVGGPLPGANLKHVRLFREIPDENGLISYDLNLDTFYKNGNRDNFVKIKPNDTIIFPQTTTSYILSYTGTVNTVLQFINLYFQIESRQ